MTDPIVTSQQQELEPVHADQEERRDLGWADRLVFFLRVMAGLSMLKGLYHWAIVCGIGAGPEGGFEAYPTPYQVGTVFFAVIDLVAAVGLWLAAPWGAVVWLTSVISMVAVEMIFPQVYGGGIWIITTEVGLLSIYLWLALQSAREQTPN
jgi:hypothetical protein